MISAGTCLCARDLDRHYPTRQKQSECLLQFVELIGVLQINKRIAPPADPEPQFLRTWLRPIANREVIVQWNESSLGYSMP